MAFLASADDVPPREVCVGQMTYYLPGDIDFEPPEICDVTVEWRDLLLRGKPFPVVTRKVVWRILHHLCGHVASRVVPEEPRWRLAIRVNRSGTGLAILLPKSDRSESRAVCNLPHFFPARRSAGDGNTSQHLREDRRRRPTQNVVARVRACRPSREAELL